MTTEPVEPLLPSLAGRPRLDRALRESLAVLRDRAEPDLRQRIEAVLAGRGSLRELARDEDFDGLAAPLVERGWAEYSALDDDEKARLAREADELDGV